MVLKGKAALKVSVRLNIPIDLALSLSTKNLGHATPTGPWTLHQASIKYKATRIPVLTLTWTANIKNPNKQKEKQTQTTWRILKPTEAGINKHKESAVVSAAVFGSELVLWCCSIHYRNLFSKRIILYFAKNLTGMAKQTDAPILQLLDNNSTIT